MNKQAPVVGSKNVTGENYQGSAAKVYFTRIIDTEHLIKLYELVNENIYDKVGIKLHTGEKHGPNILPRDMVKAFHAQIPNSAIVECNTLYPGDRYTTESHRETLKIYDSLIVLTHFKGHAMGGFGGSVKNIAIGCASGHVGKAQVHLLDLNDLPGDDDDDRWPEGEIFMEHMADSAKAVCDHFGKHIIFINVMRRMSVDCDCAGVEAEEPTIADIGICASTDILAVDQACVDMVYNAPDGNGNIRIPYSTAYQSTRHPLKTPKKNPPLKKI